MYKAGDGHVLALTASVRSLDHLLSALKISCPLITSPFKVLEEWSQKNFILPDDNFSYNPANLEYIPYQEISLDKNWQNYNINHPLTDIGLERFSADWKSIIQN